MSIIDTKIKDNSTFVYGLTNGSYVFYVGVTSYLYYRYKQHFSEQLCKDYIANMRIKGEYPNIIIYEQAEAVEHSLIWHFNINNHRLCNYHQNGYENRIISLPVDKGIKITKMPAKAHYEIIDNAINKYKNFREWQKNQAKSRLKEFR